TSGRWAKTPDSGCRLAVYGHGQQQAIQFSYEKRGPSAWDGGNARDLPVRVSIRCKHVDKPLAATNVNAATLRIQEKIIHIATGRDGLDKAAVRRGKDPQLCRLAKSHQDMRAGTIQHHREICATSRRWPRRNLLSRPTIDHVDRAGFRYIDKDAARVSVELKTLWVRLQARA